jgi:hypothetical protein
MARKSLAIGELVAQSRPHRSGCEPRPCASFPTVQHERGNTKWAARGAVSKQVLRCAALAHPAENHWRNRFADAATLVALARRFFKPRAIAGPCEELRAVAAAAAQPLTDKLTGRRCVRLRAAVLTGVEPNRLAPSGTFEARYAT